MGIRRYKPTTAGRRGATVSDFAELTHGTSPKRRCCVPKDKTGGRNNQGGSPPAIAAAGTSGSIASIDFRRNKDGVPAKVAFDPVRS